MGGKWGRGILPSLVNVDGVELEERICECGWVVVHVVWYTNGDQQAER